MECALSQSPPVSASSFYSPHKAQTLATFPVQLLTRKSQRFTFAMATSPTTPLGNGSTYAKCIYRRRISRRQSSRQLLLPCLGARERITVPPFILGYLGRPTTLWNWHLHTAIRSCSRQMFDRHNHSCKSCQLLGKTSNSDTLQYRRESGPFWCDFPPTWGKVWVPGKANENTLWMDWWWFSLSSYYSDT